MSLGNVFKSSSPYKSNQVKSNMAINMQNVLNAVPGKGLQENSFCLLEQSKRQRVDYTGQLKSNKLSFLPESSNWSKSKYSVHLFVIFESAPAGPER